MKQIKNVALGDDVNVGETSIIEGNEKHRITLGDRVRVGEFTIIRGNVKIGKETKVWHFCNLYGDDNPLIIGENTQIGSYTQIKPGVKIGSNCRIHDGVSIPEGIQIGDYVFVGAGVLFANDKYPSALDAISKTWKLSAPIVESHVSIGQGSKILPGVKIGEYSLIGMGSVVTKDVPPHSIVFGNPASVRGSTKDKKYASKFRM